MISCFYAKTALLPDPARESAFYRELPKERLKRALCLPSPEKRKESAGAGLLMVRILPRFEANTEEVYFDGRGKPLHARLAMSLSHGGGMAVLAVGEGAVGCDTERVSFVREGVLTRFTERERAFVEGYKDGRARAFFRIWTGKESYLKLTGEGVAHMKEAEIDGEGRVLRKGEVQPCGVRWKEAGEHIIAVCGEVEAVFEEIFL